MPWISPTVELIETRLVPTELSSVRRVAAQANKPDPLPDIVRGTVDEVRGYIGGWKSNRLGPSGTIPDQLMATTLAIIRFRLLNYLPTGVLDTDPRKKEYDTAVQLLRDVRLGTFAVEQPDEIGPETMPAPMPAWSGRERKFTRRQQDGI